MPTTAPVLPVAGSARALPLFGAALGLAGLGAIVVCLDALLLHTARWPILVVAFTGGTVGLAGVLRALARARLLLRVSRVRARALADADELAGHPGVRVVGEPRAAAWCAGLVRPRVVVSEGAIRTLPAPALAAVIAHERHHARRRDGLRRGIADVLAAGLFLAPDAVRAGERYAAVLELGADRAAARGPAGERGLAAALLALDQPGAGVEPERVDRLLGLPVRIAVSRRTLAAAASLLGVLAATTVACTLETGCVDIFVLRENDATASRVGVLPFLGLAAGLLAAGPGALARLALHPSPIPETA